MAVLFAAIAAVAGLSLTARLLFWRGQPAQRLPLACCSAAWIACAAAIELGSRSLWPGAALAAACAVGGFGIWLRYIWSQSLNNTTM